MTLRLEPSAASFDDAGIGVITVILVVAVLTAFLITATTMTVNNLTSTKRDRQALSALGDVRGRRRPGDPVPAQRQPGALTCLEPAAGAAPGRPAPGPGRAGSARPTPHRCSSTAPRAPASPATASRSGSARSSRTCRTAPADTPSPPVACFGIYRVHSTGLAGWGPSARKLAVDVQVTPYPFPIGVFAEALSGNGNVGVHSRASSPTAA